MISYSFYSAVGLSDAAKYFNQKGGIVVIGAGNSGGLVDQSKVPYIISVSGTDQNDELCSFSSYGPYIDFAAPSTGIWTTTSGGGYGAASGTSYSGPVLAGVIGLMFSANPALSPNQVISILRRTSVDLGERGYDEHFGWGRVDAYQAVSTALRQGYSPLESTERLS